MHIHLENIDFMKNKDKTIDVVDMLICSAERHDPELYHHIKSELYEMEHGKTFTPELAEKWVHSMEPYGQKYAMQEVITHLRTHGIGLDHTASYIVMNMMANDFADIVDGDPEQALRMTKDWLEDVDSAPDKLYNYYKYIVKK